MERLLTDNQREVLGNVASFCRDNPDSWARPLDMGGHDCSHHSATAAGLAKRGLLVRRDRGSLGGCRAVWLYRITDSGIASFHSGAA